MTTEYFTPAPPRILAHRGLAIEAPENTLLAFLRALTLGITHLETDVHASADGVAVVSHDPDLSRVAGRDVRVADLTMAQLREVDLGEGQSFCSLAEMLDAFPDARVNIDIKSPDAVVPAIEAIKDTNARARVLIGSFSTARRLGVVRALPGVATSVSALGVLPVLAAARCGATSLLRRLTRDVDALQIPPTIWRAAALTERAVGALRRVGVETHIWTINDPVEMARLLDLGVDGIVTDRADLALQVVRARG